jgi:hypothetical protein
MTAEIIKTKWQRVMAIKNALNSLCNQIDRMIVEETTLLAGKPYSPAVSRLGDLAMLWEDVAAARSRANDVLKKTNGAVEIKEVD